MPEALSDGMQISFDDHGHGELVLLFMPGWCGSRRVFDELAQRCAVRRRTLALDWRRHGRSAKPAGDFSAEDLVKDALAVIEASSAQQVVPVSLAHAGWVAIELRRRLGGRVPKLVLLEWIMLDAPALFLGALQALQDPAQWEQTRQQLFSMWLHGLDIPALTQYVREDMGSYPFEMWARGPRDQRGVCEVRKSASNSRQPRTFGGGVAFVCSARRSRIPRCAAVLQRGASVVPRREARGAQPLPDV